MLFPSEDLISARLRLVRDITKGTAEAEKRAYHELLKGDPHDSIYLLGMGKLRSAAGDEEGALSYFRRAFDSQPCYWHPCLELALREATHGQTGLAPGLIELALRKF